MQQQELYFESPKCPDYSEGQAVTHRQSRPLKANSHCHKLAVALLHGPLTSMKAITLTGGTEAPRRIRELRTYLHEHNIDLVENWEDNGTSKYKVYTLKFSDLERFKELIGV